MTEYRPYTHYLLEKQVGMLNSSDADFLLFIEIGYNDSAMEAPVRKDHPPFGIDDDMGIAIIFQ